MARKLLAHKFADRLPEMSPAEYEAHKASIATVGQIDPVILLDGKILDGRHRARACDELGIKLKTAPFDPSWGDPLEYVIAKSNHRNMSEGQKAWSAAQFADDLAKSSAPGPKKSDERKSALNSGKSSEVAGLRFGVSPRQVELAKTLMANAPSLFARLGADRDWNVNRAVQEYRRADRQRQNRKLVKGVPVDLADCKLVLGDVVNRLEELPSKSIRVIFADPPYNLGRKYHADKSGDARKDADFLAWCRKWLAECVRVLTVDGSIFVMMSGHYAARLEIILRELGLYRRNTIYWWENNPENQSGNFSDAVRPIHYFARARESFVWNDDVRVDSRRNQIGDKRGIDAGKIPDNVWIDCRIPGNSNERAPFADAPPQLPVAIPDRCIRVASEPADTVLDPFNGNGTTAVAALLNARKYIGIDQSKKYLDQSRRWIAAQLARRQRGSVASGK